MSQFYARIKPEDRAEVTRCGHKKGIQVSLDGWDRGVTVEARTDACGEDRFVVDFTNGSNGDSSRKISIMYAVGEDGKPFILISNFKTRETTCIKDF